jgi:hypothetical protein
MERDYAAFLLFVNLLIFQAGKAGKFLNPRKVNAAWFARPLLLKRAAQRKSRDTPAPPTAQLPFFLSAPH